MFIHPVVRFQLVAALHLKTLSAIGIAIMLLAIIPLQISSTVPVESRTLSSPFEDSIRISFDNATSSNVSAAIDQFGDLHVVWVDYRSGNGDIYYVKLDNEGNKLTNDAKVTNDTWASRNPTIAVDNQYNIYVVWQDNRTGNWELYLAKLQYSPKNITFLLNDIRVTDANTADSIQPDIKVNKNGEIVMVWSDARNMAGNNNYEIYFNKIDPTDGSIITTDIRVTYDIGVSIRPNLEISQNNTIHLTWYDFRDSAGGNVINHGIFYRVLSNNGVPFIPDTRITFANPNSTPSIALDPNNQVHIAFDDDRYASFDIFYTKLAWNGTTLINDRRISPQDLYYSLKPDISCDDRGFISIVWQDNASGKWVIKYDRLYSDGSILDYAQTISSSTLLNSTAPRVFVDSTNNSHVLWISEIQNNTEVYYTRTNLPDLQVSSSQILFSNITPLENTNVTVTVTVKNLGRSTALNATVNLIVGGTLRTTKSISSIAAGSQEIASLNFVVKRGDSIALISVDPENSIFETDETNNQASTSIVTLFYEYAVSTQSTSMNIFPGEERNFTLNVSNVGNTPNKIILNIFHSFPTDWIFLVNSTETDELEITVPASNYVLIPISLTVPLGAPAVSKNLMIDSKSLSDPRWNRTLGIEITVPMVGNITILSPSRPNLIPGQTYDNYFTVINLGNHLENFTVTFNETNNWTLSRGSVNISLNPMESIDVNCEIKVPEYTLPYTSSVITIYAQSSNLNYNRANSSSGAIVSRYEELHAELMEHNFSQNMLHQTTGYFQIMISNNGNINEQVNVSIICNETSWLSIDQSLLLLSPGGNRLISINLSAPMEADAGDYDFLLVVRSQANPLTYAEIRIAYHIEIYYDLSIWTDPNNVTANPGKYYNTTIYLQNFGNVWDNFDIVVELGIFNKSIAVMDGIDYSLEAEDLPSISLGPGGIAVLVLSVVVPDDLQIGNYLVVLTALSQGDPNAIFDAGFILQVEYEPTLLDFILSPAGLLIIGLAAAGIIVIVLIYLGYLSNPFIRKPKPKISSNRRQQLLKSTRPSTKGQIRGLPPKSI